MAVASNIGTGTTFTGAGLGGYTTTTAQLLSLDWSGVSRPSLSTSHMVTALTAGSEFGGGSFIPGDIVDPGEIVAVWHFDPDLTPPIHTGSGAIVVTFPETDAFTTTGFCTNVDIGDPLEEVMTITCTYKITGDVNIT